VKVGDLVRWINPYGSQPIAVVMQSNQSSSEYHHRIRVQWAGDKIPIQASAISVEGKLISSWVKPGKFETISSSSQ